MQWKLLIYRGKAFCGDTYICLWPTWSGIFCALMLIFLFCKLPNEMRHEAVNLCCSVKAISIKSELSELLLSPMELCVGSMHTVQISISDEKKHFLFSFFFLTFTLFFYLHTAHLDSKSQQRICSFKLVLFMKSFESLCISFGWFYWIGSDYEKMPAANSTFCKRHNRIPIGFIGFSVSYGCFRTSYSYSG